MLSQLIKSLTPELIIKAVQDNPDIIRATLFKFDTTKLLAKALTTEQQICISNNGKLINNFLDCEEGKAAIGLLAEEFSLFVDNVKIRVEEKIAIATKAAEDAALADIARTKDLEESITKAQEEVSLRTSLEKQIRREMEERMDREIEARISARMPALKLAA